MESIKEITQDFFSMVDFKEREFFYCVLWTVISSLSFTILPHLEYKRKILSRIFQTKSRAADGTAFFMINAASYRFYSLLECIYVQDKISLDSNYLAALALIGALMIVTGAYLIVTSFRHLGLRGMYFGDHFGFKLNKRISEFPYDKLENPQYFGEKLIYFGFATAYASPSGLVLSVFFILCTQVIFMVEKSKLDIFYPEDN